MLVSDEIPDATDGAFILRVRGFAELLQLVREIRCETAIIRQQNTEILKRLSQIGGGLMFIVKNDNPDVGYHITAPNVTDAEGEPVDAGALTFEVSSDNEGVLAVAPADPLNGSVHFGASGQANINVNVKNAAGTLLGAFGAQFTVTTGDPAAISGGTIAFDGLVES